MISVRGSDCRDVAEIELAKFQVSPGEEKVSTRGEHIAVLTAGEETRDERRTLNGVARERSAISRASFGINHTPPLEVRRTEREVTNNSQLYIERA